MNLKIEVNDSTNFAMQDSSCFAIEAEALGFSGVGMPDHPHTGQDVFERLITAAQDTARIMLFPSVTNPITRTVEELSVKAKELRTVALGRTRLILGGGDNAVGFLGKKPATTLELINAVQMIKAELAGTGVEVFINGSSPKMLEAGGLIADGVYAMVGVDPVVVNTALEHVFQGARKGGRDPESIPIALGLPVFMASSLEQSIEYALPYAFSSLKRRTRVFSRVLRSILPALENASNYTDLSKKDAWKLTEAMAICGSPREAADKTHELARKIGHTHFIARVQMQGVEPIEALKAYGKQIYFPE